MPIHRRVILCCIFLAGLLPAGRLPANESSVRLADPAGFKAIVEEASAEVHPRFYYMHRRFSETTTQESSALGGWITLRSGAWQGLRLQLTPYTSQRIYGSDNRDGASLLAPGQQGYTVLGEAHLEWTGAGNTVKFWRQSLETPLINTFDVKMTPVTVEALTLQNTNIEGLTLTMAHVFGIKPWTASRFMSMTEAAGIEADSRPVTLAGAHFAPTPELQIQLWNYLAYDFMNMLYGQADSTWQPRPGLDLTLSGQALQESSIGGETYGEFRASMAGLQAAAGWAGLTLTLGGTITENSHDIVNPWGSYPAFTSIMEEDCNTRGEKAWVLGLAYDFQHIGLSGLSALINHTEAWNSEKGSLTGPEQLEYNLTIDYRLPALPDLWLRLRAAKVVNSLSDDGLDYEDYRAIVNYHFMF
ncbi:MAG: OprD family outer membrane porin [Kiritimatiellia bacterium]|nr:OprD family porin [Lentisphaerota bacterium]